MSYLESEDPGKFNQLVSHPLQSFEWGEFRKKTGLKVIRRMDLSKNPQDAYQLTIHPLPFSNFKIGYLPKGNLPTEDLLGDLSKVGKQENLIYILLEPNVHQSSIINHQSLNGLRPSFHPLFTKFTFVLDLTQSEEELLKGMHPKTRYNIRVAQKHGVKISQDFSPKAFDEYLKLTWETTKRQGFYAHDKNYHRLLWETLRANSQSSIINGQLSAHLFTAKYKGEVLTAWIVFIFKDKIYYPYGASSSKNREVMASNLMMWEVIRFGKERGLKELDMWGSLGPEPDQNDPWFGFHRFKQGYGAKLVEFAGSYDLVINPLLYEGLKLADKARWFYLKIRR